MGRPLVLVAAAAALLAALLAWWLLREPEVAPELARAVDQPGIPQLAPESSALLPTAPRPEPRAAAPVGEPNPNATEHGLQLRVRLRGLHPSAPWTSPLQLDVEGRDEAADRWCEHDVNATPDAAGLATFALPDWWATASRLQGRLTADDPNYREVEHRWQGTRDLAQELVVDVQVTGSLIGRVVDENGTAVAAARIVAYALRGIDPVDGELAMTNTQIDGSWRLRVPPAVPLWLLAIPMQPAEGVRRVSGRDGAVLDNGQMRADLWPASTAAGARLGAPTTVPDLVLPMAARLTGRVRWSDGEAIPEARVELMPGDGITFALSNSTFVERHPDGHLSPGAQASTDEHGEFVLPAMPGPAARVRIAHLGETGERGELVGPRPMQPALPPQPVEFVLPRPILLRARRDGQPIAQATIEVAEQRPRMTNRRGELTIVPTAVLRVRASHERLRSSWRDLGPDDANTTIDLELQTARTPLAIEFDGEFRVRNTVITWRRDDGLGGREHLLRDDRGGPFQIFLEPGRYHLTAGPGGGERNGVFLLPMERDVDVGGDPIVLRLPAVFGGTFTIMVTDGAGRWVGGTCQVRDNSGTDVTESFRLPNGGQSREGIRGEVLAGGVNAFTRILPPGDYELMGDFGEHGVQRQRFTIKPRELTEVYVRLP